MTRYALYQRFSNSPTFYFENYIESKDAFAWEDIAQEAQEQGLLDDIEDGEQFILQFAGEGINPGGMAILTKTTVPQPAYIFTVDGG